MLAYLRAWRSRERDSGTGACFAPHFPPQVRVVPSFFILDEGAVVHRMLGRDIRRMGHVSGAVFHAALAEDMALMKEQLLEQLLRRAPSARD